MAYYDHDEGHGQPMKDFVHFDFNDHGSDKDHGKAMKVSKDEDEDEDEDEGSPFVSNQSRDDGHDLIVTWHYDWNQDHDPSVKLSDV